MTLGAPECHLHTGQKMGEYCHNFMIDFGVGVATDAIYELKRLDSDCFTES